MVEGSSPSIPAVWKKQDLLHQLIWLERNPYCRGWFGMTMFGINLVLDTRNFATNTDLTVSLTERLLKRDNERKLFYKFLNSTLTDNTTVLESIYVKAQDEIATETSPVPSEALVNFVTSKLKHTATQHTTLYHQLVRQIIEEIDPGFILLHKRIDIGKFDGKVPFGYPSISKKAEGLLQAKIKDSINTKTSEQYLLEKNIEHQMKILTKEMFLGINDFDLTEDDLLKYLLAIFELNLLEDCPGINPRDLKVQVAEALKNKSVLNLIHIKCLRFVYPETGGVDILTNTSDATIGGVLGKYSPKSEAQLFPRLQRIKNIFTRQGITVNFRIILADEDLDLLFPDESIYVNKNQKQELTKKIKLYLSTLQRLHGQDFVFANLTHLTQGNNEYKKFQQMVLQDLYQNGGKFVNPDFFEKDRVDHQYTYYQQLFGPSYSRSEARRSISEQTASTIALEEVLRNISENLVLVEENRGGENKLIANSQYPVFFTKLRDEAKFDVK